MLSGFIIFILPVVAVVSAAIYIPVYFLSRHSTGKQPFSHHLFRYALIGYLLSLVYLTLLWYYPNITFTPEYHFLNLIPFDWVTNEYTMGKAKMAEQLLLNIGMFIPYGVLLPLNFHAMRRFHRTAGTVLFTTVAIETVQYFMGRSADIDDVIMNLFGGIAGYLGFVCIRAIGRKASGGNVAAPPRCDDALPESPAAL